MLVLYFQAQRSIKLKKSLEVITIKGSIGHVALLAIILPYDIKLSFMPNVADVEYVAFLTVQVYLYFSVFNHPFLYI